MQLQGDFVDLLPPGGGTTGHRKVPRRSETCQSAGRGVFFSPHQSKPGEPLRNDQSSVGPPPNPTSVPSLSWLSCRPAGLQIVLSQLDGRQRLKARKKKEAGGGEEMFSSTISTDQRHMRSCWNAAKRSPPAPLQRQPLLERKPGRALKIQHRRSRGGGGDTRHTHTRSICLAVIMTQRSANRNHERNRDANPRFFRFTPQVHPPPSC